MQLKITDFTDKKEKQLLDRESDLAAEQMGRELFDSKVGVANVTKRKRRT